MQRFWRKLLAPFPRGYRLKANTGHRRQAWRPLYCEELEPRTLLSVSLITGSDPTQAVTSFLEPNGKQLLVPLRATDSTNAAVSFSVTSNSNSQVAAEIVAASQ